MNSSTKSFLKKALIIVGGLLCLGLLLAVPAYRQAREFMLTYLLKQAQRFAEEGSPNLAYDHAVRAAHLFPESNVARLQLARVVLDFPQYNNPALLESILDLPERTPEDLKRYYEYLLASFQIDHAAQLVERLFEEMPEDEEVQRYYLESALRKREFGRVVQKASDLLAKGHDRGFIHEAYLVSLWAMDTPQSKAAALNALVTYIERKDEVGLKSAKQLLASATAEAPEKTRVAKLILDNPTASVRDCIFAFQEIQNAVLVDSKEILQEYAAVLSADTEEGLKAWTGWHFEKGQFAEILELAEPERFFQDALTCQYYHLALIQTGKAQAAYENTIRTDLELPLSQVENLIIRAAAQQALGKLEEMEASLNLAVEQSAIAEITMLENTLFQMEAWGVLEKLYNRIIAMEGVEYIGYQKMVFAKYLQGDEFEVIRNLNEIDFQSFLREPPVLAFLAYLDLVLGRDSVESRFFLEKLIADYPNVPDFQVVQAFYFLVDGKPQDAWELISDDAPAIMEKGSRFQRLVFYLVAKAVGNSGNLEPMLEYFRNENLLTSERRLLFQMAKFKPEKQ